ncbi:uncharacterized protein [Amphiura filiformis]|uniref:uncharacterized protein n=1 Tax=Amphiura filiformis TaxID=82378 RepID=UPI003B21D308
MWTLYGFGITVLILLGYQEIQARVLPQITPEEPAKSSTEDKYDFLDHISASKLECLLQFVEQPDVKLQCIDKLFGDDRSQYLLDELQEELAAGFVPEALTTGAAGDNDEDDDDVDELVADLNTLSGKAGPLSTINDDIPIINSNKEKRVEEQVDTPKQEEQRNAQGYITPKVIAEVVKSDEVDNDDNRNKIGTTAVADDYEYDSSLVSKLYNMLQDLVLKETFDYGLDMNGDDNDSDEEKPAENVIQNTVATEQNNNDGSDSESEEEDDEQDEGRAQYANELNTSDEDDDDDDDNDEDEIERELQQMHGTAQTDDDDDDDDDGDDSDEDDINAIENDLVRELNKMLTMAQEAAASKGV